MKRQRRGKAISSLQSNFRMHGFETLGTYADQKRTWANVFDETIGLDEIFTESQVHQSD